PRHIVIRGREEFARGIPEPLLGEQGDDFLVSHACRLTDRISGKHYTQRPGQVPAGPEPQVTHLSRSGIHLDEVRVARSLLDDEIEAEQSGELEFVGDFFDCRPYLAVVD